MLVRVLGALLCVVGLVVGGLAVASATLWRASDTLTASATAASGSSFLVTEPGVLDLAARDVTVSAEAPGAAVVVALGRSVDVAAWVGDSPATRVTGLVDRTTLATDAGTGGAASTAPTGPEPSGTAPTEGAVGGQTPEQTPEATPEETPTEAGTDGEEATAGEPVPDPRGADLWLEEVSGDGAAELRWQAQDGRWSVLVASLDPDVPPTLTLSWPQTVATPWLVPGLVLGGLLLLAGAAVLLVGLRRTRPVPMTAADGGPDDAGPAVRGAEVSGSPAGQRPLTRRELRELRDRQARGGTVPAGPATGTVPVPGAGPGRGSAPGTVQGAGQESVPGKVPGTAPPGATSPADDVAPSGRGGATPAGGPSVADVPGHGPRPGGPASRGGLPPAAGRLGPRRPAAPATGAAAPGPSTAGPAAAPPPGGKGPAGHAQAGQGSVGPGSVGQGSAGPGSAGQNPAAPGVRPAPGASAWRQTWGLPSGVPTGTPADPPTASGQDTSDAPPERGDEDDTTTDGGAR